MKQSLRKHRPSCHFTLPRLRSPLIFQRPDQLQVGPRLLGPVFLPGTAASRQLRRELKDLGSRKPVPAVTALSLIRKNLPRKQHEETRLSTINYTWQIKNVILFPHQDNIRIAGTCTPSLEVETFMVGVFHQE